MYGKPLAYIVKIKSIEPLTEIATGQPAANIELAHVMDYSVVVKKHEYQPGDLALYVEVDSILPDGFTPDQKVTYEAIKDGSYFKNEEVENAAEATKVALERLAAASKYPYFEFLREKKFKIKSMKFNKFGVISQGILFKPSDLKITDAKLGKDYTERFEIRELVQDDEEAGLNTSVQKDSWIVRKLMRYKWFRDWRKRKKISETWDPTFPGKSDEENVQKLFSTMKEKYGDKIWTLTEKLEGQNITIYTEDVEVPRLFRSPKREKRVGVCSRTRELRPDGTGKNFWATVKRLGLDEKIKKIPGEWFCRGEHVGPGIQGNIYKLPETDIVFFDFYRKEYYIDVQDRNKRKFKWVKLNFEDSRLFAQQWGLKFVPVIDDNYKLPETAQEMLQQSDKNTEFGFNLKHKREGFVARLKDDYTVSFKVKNPFYSI